jgi:outer membrane protein W
VNRLKQILSLSVALMIMHQANAHAQSTSNNSYAKIDKKITIGFRTAQSVLFHLYPQTAHNSKTRATSKTLFLSLPVCNHFKIEAGLTYNVLTPQFTRFNGMDKPGKFRGLPGELTIPLTVQYHFLKKKSKIHPYIGAGFQYRAKAYNLLSQPANADWVPNISQYKPNDVGLMFTEGIIYQINTKIQLNQSFHFIQSCCGGKNIGLDLGISFTLK